MKQLKRVAALTMVIVMLAVNFVFAAGVSIVSPASNSIVYTDSLLVSVKVTEPKTIRVTVYEKRVKAGDSSVAADVSGVTSDNIAAYAADAKFSDVVISKAEDYTNTGEIGFYTKQLSVKPGLYKVKVETLETVIEWPPEGGDPVEAVIVTDTASSVVAVKTKPAEQKQTTLTTNSSGALTFIHKILKSIFR